MKARHAASFIVFTVITACAAYYIASLGVRAGPPKDRINVSMQVPDTNGLVVDSNVLLRGVPVGKVTGIHASIRGTTVDFYVDKKFPIPIDSEVRLENLSALGESYIGLMPRSTSGPTLRDGQRVATADIRAPASISELATNASRLLSQTDPAQLSRLVAEADHALPNVDAVLPNLTRASTLLRNSVRTMNGTGSDVLANVQTLLQNAGWVGPDLAQISRPLLPAAELFQFGMHYAALSTFKVGGVVGINNVGFLFDRFQKFLDERAPDLKVIAQTLTPNVQGIAASLMNVDTGQMLTNVLNQVPEDGIITLHLTTPNP